MADKVDGERQSPADVFDGITNEDYALWLIHDPIASRLMRFLRDYREAAIRDMTAAWESGSLDPERSLDLRGYCRALKEITTIRIPEIAAFYGQEAASAAAAEEAERAEVNGSQAD